MVRRHVSLPRVAVLALVSVVASAGCGSTVQSRGSGLAGPDAITSELGDGLPAPGGDAAPTSSGTELPAGPGEAAATGTTDHGEGGTATTVGPSASRSTAAGAGAGIESNVPTGPGVTATSIALGIPYCNDCAAGNAAIGAGSDDPGDTRRYYQAALDDVNSRGVLGRKLVPVFHETSVSDTSLDAVAQEQCEAFTKDNKVLIMTSRGDVANQCAKNAGIMILGPGSTGPTYERFPGLFSPAGVRLERLGAVTVKSMVRAGWHKPDATWPLGRIGLITWEAPEYMYAMKHGYLRALHEAGLKETDVRYIAVPQSASSLSDASAAISAAVLAFRQQGIDHVFIADGPAGVFLNAGLTFMFLQNAKSQEYYPRYAMNSNNDPDFPAHPKDQLVGMLAIDASDSEAANDQGIALNPVRERCFALMRKKGLTVGGNHSRGLALEACGLAWFAEAVLNRAIAGTTLPKMIAAAESLGTSYRAPSSYGNRIGPGQHDGAALFRELRFDDRCECVQYTSKPFEP